MQHMLRLENLFPNDTQFFTSVGAGIAGLTLAAALSPLEYKVRVFEAATDVREKGYGLAVWPSSMRILRDALGIAGLEVNPCSSIGRVPMRSLRFGLLWKSKIKVS